MPNIPVTWRNEQTVNTVTTGAQSEPDIIQLANGNILVAWTSGQNSGAGSPPSRDIVGQIYDPLGDKVGGEFLINTAFSADGEQDVSLAATPNGGFVAVFEDVDIDFGVTRIRLQTFSAAGAPLTANTVILDSDTAAPNFSDPAVAVSSATSMLITYRQTTSGANPLSGLYGRIYDSTTDTFGSEFPISLLASDASITVLANGNYVVTGSVVNYITYTIISPTGATVQAATTVAGTSSSPVDRDPSVAAIPQSGGGGFVIAWERDTAIGTEIAFRRYDPAGVQVGEGAFGDSASVFKTPVVDVLADRTIVITYRDAPGTAMVSHHFSETGASLGPLSFAGLGTNPASTALGDGRYAVAWENGASEISLEILDTRDGMNNPGVYVPDQWQIGTNGADNVAVDGISELVHGWDGDDRLTESGEGRSYFGDLGNDVLVVTSVIASDSHDGGGGIDTIDWSSSSQVDGVYDLQFGQARITGGATEVMIGFENLNGTEQNDRILGSSAANLLLGNGGDDVILGSGGGDTLRGGSGDDTLVGGAGADVLEGGIGSDRASYSSTVLAVTVNLVTGTSNDGDTLDSIEDLQGGLGGDTLVGDDNVNVLDGYDGNDSLQGGLGADLLIGGTGTDTASYAERELTGITVNLATGANTDGDSFQSIENVTGTLANDILIGDDNVNVLHGNEGNDVLQGGLGADTLIGGGDTNTASYAERLTGIDANLATGANTDNDVYDQIRNLVGGGGVDSLIGDANANRLEGRGGTDVLDGGLGADVLDGGDGLDFVSYNRATSVTVNLVNGQNTDGDTFISIERIGGGTAGDTLIGNDEGNTFFGLQGDDFLDGRGGNDSLSGGTGIDTLDGGEADDTLSGGDGADSLAGGNGSDTADYSIVSTFGVSADLTTGANTEGDSYSSIENLRGGALADTLTGSEIANILEGQTGDDALEGLAGSDRLDGGLGVDTMRGGADDDTYVVDNAGDRALETAGAGTDTVESSIRFTLGANLERLILTGSASVNAAGNGLDNFIEGNSGSNLLNGLAGADTMRGGGGDDRYIVDEAGDRAEETSALGGIDLVQSAVTFTLGANIEQLLLTGSASINGAGNALNNRITGNNGSNVLNGLAGADTMLGGFGNDTYVVDNTGDITGESSASGGFDTVQTSIAWTLLANLERLVMTGSSNINGAGNALDNVLIGNSGNNILNGFAGADILRGGLGDDTYIVDNIGDVAEENSGAGNDRVQSSVSFTLGANVEELVLTGIAGINGTGNAGVNIINGNNGSNMLDGAAGADLMRGGLGDDIYSVDNAGDQATESSATGGNDTVASTVSFTLANFVENLILAGSAAIDGTGNGLGNAISGNAAANVLRGLAGNDLLDGGAGPDSYLFDTALDAANNVDLVAGFEVGLDRIVLENSVFAGLATGALSAPAFRTGAAAADPDDRIIYNGATGALFFDPDGNGAAAQVQFATLAAGLALGATDFAVV